jgi:hypothetical protein
MKSIATAADSTGTANRIKKAVMSSAQTGKGKRNIVMPGARMLMVVVI